MAAYKRTIVRLGLLGLMITGGVLLNSSVVQASGTPTTCKETCLTNERECISECRNSSGCLQICQEEFQLCIQECD
jgi:hypothetical protein